MKTKTTNIIQRLCLFLFVLVLTASAWATDYHCVGYSVFRSRNTVESMGKNKRIDIPLTEGKVEIIFTNCKTTSGTGSGAIYELAKGSRIIIRADDGYAIRWIILRDTEGGERYSTPNGIKRISSASGYDYYFEKEAISNSGISGANQNELNDDDNNIVVNEYDATEQTVFIDSHDNPK